MATTAWASLSDQDWASEETREALAGGMIAASLGAQLLINELVEDVALVRCTRPPTG